MMDIQIPHSAAGNLVDRSFGAAHEWVAYRGSRSKPWVRASAACHRRRVQEILAGGFAQLAVGEVLHGKSASSRIRGVLLMQSRRIACTADR
jgi:hypothetical protein